MGETHEWLEVRTRHKERVVWNARDGAVQWQGQDERTRETVWLRIKFFPPRKSFRVDRGLARDWRFVYRAGRTLCFFFLISSKKICQRYFTLSRRFSVYFSSYVYVDSYNRPVKYIYYINILAHLCKWMT